MNEPRGGIDDGDGERKSHKSESDKKIENGDGREEDNKERVIDDTSIDSEHPKQDEPNKMKEEGMADNGKNGIPHADNNQITNETQDPKTIAANPDNATGAGGKKPKKEREKDPKGMDMENVDPDLGKDELEDILEIDDRDNLGGNQDLLKSFQQGLNAMEVGGTVTVSTVNEFLQKTQDKIVPLFEYMKNIYALPGEGVTPTEKTRILYCLITGVYTAVEREQYIIISRIRDRIAEYWDLTNFFSRYGKRKAQDVPSIYEIVLVGKRSSNFIQAIQLATFLERSKNIFTFTTIHKIEAEETEDNEDEVKEKKITIQHLVAPTQLGEFFEHLAKYYSVNIDEHYQIRLKQGEKPEIPLEHMSTLKKLMTALDRGSFTRLEEKANDRADREEEEEDRRSNLGAEKKPKKLTVNKRENVPYASLGYNIEKDMRLLQKRINAANKPSESNVTYEQDGTTTTEFAISELDSFIFSNLPHKCREWMLEKALKIMLEGEEHIIKYPEYTQNTTAIEIIYPPRYRAPERGTFFTGDIPINSEYVPPTSSDWDEASELEIDHTQFFLKYDRDNKERERDSKMCTKIYKLVQDAVGLDIFGCNRIHVDYKQEVKECAFVNVLTAYYFMNAVHSYDTTLVCTVKHKGIAETYCKYTEGRQPRLYTRDEATNITKYNQRQMKHLSINTSGMFLETGMPHFKGINRYFNASMYQIWMIHWEDAVSQAGFKLVARRKTKY